MKLTGQVPVAVVLAILASQRLIATLIANPLQVPPTNPPYFTEDFARLRGHAVEIHTGRIAEIHCVAARLRPARHRNSLRRRRGALPEGRAIGD